jgi:phospholipid-binding lipoprotein MlaA
MSATARAPARLALLILASALIGGCAGTNPRDPWEGWNRPVHEFNDSLDRNILKPVAEGYREVTPGFAQTGVSNFLDNLNDLGTGLNNIAQGKVANGLSDLGRFGFNSVVGIFGLWDVATPLGLEKHNEDFGQTLGWWGVPSGPYFVIPFLGPSTARDAPARVVDPSFAYNRWIEPEGLRFFLFGLDVVRTRAQLLQAERIVEEAALDRYSFIRDAWMQRRRNLVHDGRPPKLTDDEE